MSMKYYFSAAGDYLGGFDEGSLDKVPQGAIQVDAPPADGRDRLVNGVIVSYVAPIDPLAELTTAVLALPVAKRTDAAWGGFVGQCLLAIQHDDLEALGYLLDNHTFVDANYLAIIASAKELFSLQ